MNASHNKQNAKTPDKAKLKAYIAMAVKRLPGIVSPPGVENFEKHVAADQLKKCR